MKTKQDNYEVKIHFLMALCGGFLGGYTIFERMAVFGSAQTANLIELIQDIIGRDYGEMLLRIGALLIYIAAMILSVILHHQKNINTKYLTLILEMVTVLFLGFFPQNINPILALYPIFFITAFQWCVFKGALGYVSSTIFSTNNIKQTVLSLTEYFLTSDLQEKEEKLRKGKFFGGTLLSFHIGVACSFLLGQAFSLQSIWFLEIPLCFTLFYLIYAQKHIQLSMKECLE